MERRNLDEKRSSTLPADYLKMVDEVFASNFDEGLKKLAKLSKDTIQFETSGGIYPSEIVLCVTLAQGEGLAATTVYASTDFDPKASSPTIQDLLASCVDAIGSVYQPLMDAEKPEALTALLDTTLSSLDDVPFEWTAMDVEKRRIFVKVDKTNPKLEFLADAWLRKHDPELEEREAEEQEETEKLFVTGPTKAQRGRGPGTLQ